MCLAVPGEIVAIVGASGPAPVARVSFGGIIRPIQLALVPEACVGDHVLCHVGCAISVIDASRAAELWAVLASQGYETSVTESDNREGRAQ